MKQQFAAKHPWTILAAGRPFRCLRAYRRLGAFFSSRSWRNTAFRSRGRMPLPCSSPPLGWGVCWAVFCRIKRGRAARRCGARPCSAAAFLQRPFCRAGQGGGSFWPSASGGAGHSLFVPLYPVLRPKVVCGAQGAGDRGHRRSGGTFRRVPDPVRPGGAAGLWPGAGDPGRVLGAWRAHPAGVPCRQCGAAATHRRKKQQPSGKNTLDLSPGQMLRTKQYWLCAGAVCFSTPAVLLFSPIILKLGMERGLDETAALWSIVLGSVGSAAGRMLMPMLSDHIGRRPTDLRLFVVRLGCRRRSGRRGAGGWWRATPGSPSATRRWRRCCLPFPPTCSAAPMRG